MARRDDSKEVRDALIDCSSYMDDDSDEGMLMKLLSFQRATRSFQEYCRTENKCKNDIQLALTRIDASTDYIVVWLHDGEPLDDHIRHDAEKKLRLVFINTQFFTSMDTCLCYLKQLDVDSVHLIFISSYFYDGRVSKF
jgi:hypothetical protein